MEHNFAGRMAKVPRSFIREILQFSMQPGMISFAGGLPNPNFFPVKELEMATAAVFAECGEDALQYSASAGLLRLRQQISERYAKNSSIEIDPENIIITCGSQQGLDLIGKIFIDVDSKVLIEEPGYLGAIQALSVFEPQFLPVPLVSGGADCDSMAGLSMDKESRLFYCVPSFQNPSGASYSEETIASVAKIAKNNKFVVVEDNPYGELRFKGEAPPSFYSYLPEQTILLGTFSKTVAPGFRLGWIAASAEIIEKLMTVKQATDLHTSSFSQLIVSKYLEDNNLDEHLAKTAKAYGENCAAMEEALCPLKDEITFTEPEGGMFLWGCLPEGMESMKLFDFCVEEKVVFVPGEPFYTKAGATRTFRLSFSCVAGEVMLEGVERFKRAYAAYKASLV
ncbi:MAG: PLP-dependent aminotransferase family protein [Desulfotalea sp.]